MNIKPQTVIPPGVRIKVCEPSKRKAGARFDTKFAQRRGNRPLPDFRPENKPKAERDEIRWLYENFTDKKATYIAQLIAPKLRK